jgi:hypothetical protein
MDHNDNPSIPTDILLDDNLPIPDPIIDQEIGHGENEGVVGHGENKGVRFVYPHPNIEDENEGAPAPVNNTNDTDSVNDGKLQLVTHASGYSLCSNRGHHYHHCLEHQMDNL